MTQTFLDKIITARQSRLASRSNLSRHENDFFAESKRDSSGRIAGRFRAAIADATRSGIIAEFKRASPSKGVINADLSPERAAIAYESAGAAAISVLTEEDFFLGSISDLIAVRSVTKLPVLRKDFIIDESQIYESAATGADAILLIAALLPTADLRKFRETAESLAMDALVEVHNESEMLSAIESGARIIGVNNRDLKTFDVSLETSKRLIGLRPPDCLMVAESGISAPDEIAMLRRLGYQGFLIGERFMRAAEPEAFLSQFIRAASGDNSGA